MIAGKRPGDDPNQGRTISTSPAKHVVGYGGPYEISFSKMRASFWWWRPCWPGWERLKFQCLAAALLALARSICSSWLWRISKASMKPGECQ